MSAGPGDPDPWQQPLQILLGQLRAWKPDAYRCMPGPGSWVADCVVCGQQLGVRIDEHVVGGRVWVQCRTGCTPAEIGVALDRAADHADPWVRLEQHELLITQLQTLVEEQAAFIDRLTRPLEVVAA